MNFVEISVTIYLLSLLLFYSHIVHCFVERSFQYLLCGIDCSVAIRCVCVSL